MYYEDQARRYTMMSGLLFGALEAGGRQMQVEAGVRMDLIGIIQALQHDPELAILDEPSEGLDPLMQRAFYEILEERRAAGRTIFFSTLSKLISNASPVLKRTL
jgi:ABC-2 type transport system ATP-binding protein